MKHEPAPEGPKFKVGDKVMRNHRLANETNLGIEMGCEGEVEFVTEDGRYLTFVGVGGSFQSMNFIHAEQANLPAIPPGFMRWHGGKRPFRKGVLVDVVFRNGESLLGDEAIRHDWHHGDGDWDIIACKISEAD